MSTNTHTQAAFVNVTQNQLIVFVRYNIAANPSLTAASSMLGSVTEKVNSVANSIDSITDHIPGMIKEQKGVSVAADKEWNYHTHYAEDWDKKIENCKNDLIGLNPKNKVLVYEYQKADTQNNQTQEGDKLAQQIVQIMASWKGLSAALHFVALAEGAFIALASLSSLEKQNDFKQKWTISSFISIAAGLNTSLLTSPLLQQGTAIKNFQNPFDLKSAVVDYFEPQDQLIDYIARCNSNLFSYMATGLGVRVVKIVSLLFGEKNINTTNGISDLENAFQQGKTEIIGLVTDLVSMIKQLIDNIPGLLYLPQIPEFSKFYSGLSNLPQQCGDRFFDFIKNDLKKVYAGGMKLDSDAIPIEKAFNALVPLVNHLSNMLSIFTLNEKDSKEQLLNNIAKHAGIKKVKKPYDGNIEWVAVDSFYTNIIIENSKKNNTEMATALIGQARTDTTLLAKDTDKENNIKDSLATKQHLVKILTTLCLPMLSTKKVLYEILMKKIPLGGVTAFFDLLDSNKVTQPLVTIIKKVRNNFDFDNTDSPDTNKIGLKRALANLNVEVNKVKAYFDTTQFTMDERINSLYLIYNSHNLMLRKMHSPIRLFLDKQTCIYSDKLNKGFQFDEVKNEYIAPASGASTAEYYTIAKQKDSEKTPA